MARIRSGGVGTTVEDYEFAILTTKGDLLGHSGTLPVRLPVGTDNQLLICDSTQALGIKWADAYIVERIATREASGTESTDTFSGLSLLEETYSKLILVLRGSETAALSLLLRVNGLSSGIYWDDGSRFTGGVETLLNADSQTSCIVCSSSMFSAANLNFFVVIEIGIYDTGNSSRSANAFSRATTGLDAYEHRSHLINSNIDSITSITILTSTSTWKAGTKFDLYGVKRA